MGWEWNVAVFCQNEEDTIGACLEAIDRACAGRRVLVCLIVNGSSDRSAERAVACAQGCGFDFVLAEIEAGDKSNAINTFNYELRVPAELYIYLDGYVKFAPEAFAALAEALVAHPEAVASTGVSANGRTMKLATAATLSVGGQLHGQLHAFRPSFIARMVAAGVRLPMRLYRGDGLLGSMAAHDLDAIGEPWVNARIVGVEVAQYFIQSLSLFRLQDLRRQFRRMVRQARGRLENMAIKDVIYREGYAALPLYADDMIASHLAAHGEPAVSGVGRLFQGLALREVRAARPFAAERLAVRLGHVQGEGVAEAVGGVNR